jgi:hypothetical protein
MQPTLSTSEKYYLLSHKTQPAHSNNELAQRIMEDLRAKAEKAKSLPLQPETLSLSVDDKVSRKRKRGRKRRKRRRKIK